MTRAVVSENPSARGDVDGAKAKVGAALRSIAREPFSQQRSVGGNFWGYSVSWFVAQLNLSSGAARLRHHFQLRGDLNRRLADRRVTGKLDPKAKEWVAEKGYDPVFGARPLKRFLQRTIETKLARALIAAEVGEGSDITFTVQNGELAQVAALDRGTSARARPVAAGDPRLSPEIIPSLGGFSSSKHGGLVSLFCILMRSDFCLPPRNAGA